MGTSWIAASVAVVWACGWVTFQPPPAISWATLIVAAAGVLFNVITQQILLCGYIFHTIQHRSNLATAVFVSAVLFAAYHAGAYKGVMLPAINVFLAGLLFCLAYALTSNLWLPVAMHFAWNLLLGPVLGLTVSGSGHLGSGWRVLQLEGPALFTGGAFGLEGSLAVTLTTGVTIAALFRLQPARPPWSSNLARQTSLGR